LDIGTLRAQIACGERTGGNRMRDPSATPSSYFEQAWAHSADPWDHAGRWYEARKYDLTTAALPNERYLHAVEPACGVGLLTMRLAARADRVSASDRYRRAVDVTAARCRALGNVDVRVADVRDGPASDAILDVDLVVLGEVLYYFPPETLGALVSAWHARCSRGGHLVLVHYRPVVDQHVLTGDDVHEIVRATLGTPAVACTDPQFLIDVYDAG
ncbi:MAG: class I SAM-dependent methyltransferase, partial [Ilumatobacteraceae bacterium]